MGTKFSSCREVFRPQVLTGRPNVTCLRPKNSVGSTDSICRMFAVQSVAAWLPTILLIGVVLTLVPSEI